METTIKKSEFEAAIVGAVVMVRAGWDTLRAAEVLQELSENVTGGDALSIERCLRLIEKELKKTE